MREPALHDSGGERREHAHAGHRRGRRRAGGRGGRRACPSAGPTTAKASSGPVTTQVMVLVSLPSSSAIRGIETERIVMVKPTENRPNSATARTIHGYCGLPAMRSTHALARASAATGRPRPRRRRAPRSTAPRDGCRRGRARHEDKEPPVGSHTREPTRTYPTGWGGGLIAAAGERHVQHAAPASRARAPDRTRDRSSAPALASGQDRRAARSARSSIVQRSSRSSRSADPPRLHHAGPCRPARRTCGR